MKDLSDYLGINIGLGISLSTIYILLHRTLNKMFQKPISSEQIPAA